MFLISWLLLLDELVVNLLEFADRWLEGLVEDETDGKVFESFFKLGVKTVIFLAAVPDGRYVAVDETFDCCVGVGSCKAWGWAEQVYGAVVASQAADIVVQL